MELQQLGLNAVTVGALGVIFFAFVQAWGLWQQKKTIWKNQSGQSISVTWLSYFTCLDVVVFIYGWSINSIAMMVNGGLIFLYVLIMIGLWKFKGFSKLEKFLGICLLIVIVVTIFIPAKDWMFLIVSFGSILSLIMQPYEIWKNKNSGVVEIKLIIVYLISTTFWIIYGYTINDWVLKIICPSYFVIFSITVCFWFIYRNPNHSKKEA